jgi:predicted cupin superfamily sugar epimerase
MDPSFDASTLAARLDLAPHPEGGWYRETHRSGTDVGTSGGPRSAITSILFLLEHPDVSHLHRIDAEELWYWHGGSDLLIQEIRPDGTHLTHRLGTGGSFQAAIPAGSWFGAELAEQGSWALVGCAVAPGFTFAGFELGAREDLLAKFPSLSDLVVRLT